MVLKPLIQPRANNPTQGDNLGEILNDAVMQVMPPSLEYYDKIALTHVSKYANDYTGEIIHRHGTIHRGCIGLIHYVPEEAHERPW
ncbi:hypothetical protein ACUW9K_002359 [Corynebacterium hesseae]